MFAPTTIFAAKLDPEAIEQFVQQMQREQGLDPDTLRGELSRASRLDNVIAMIAKPAEYKPWFQYRPIFINEARIAGGLDFWRRNAAALAATAAATGVPPEIMIAIMGVETSYGRETGNFRVLDALATLAFGYPPRAPFFRSELMNLLLLAREEHLDPSTLKGSYAGAMGIPQFMPSSFRTYAVDFNKNGRRDIWTSPEDAIASVGNYLQRQHWQAGTPIAFRAVVTNATPPVGKSVELERSLADYATLGVKPDGAAITDVRAVLLAYEGTYASEYWLGLQNFYVITRYNRSPKYALAVFELAEEIRLRHAREVP